MIRVHGGAKFYRGAAKAARSYLERDCARYDDYYLAEGDGLAIRLVAQATQSGAAVETKQEMDGETYEQWVGGINVDTPAQASARPRG